MTTKNTLPMSVHFILADDIREEINGKVSIIGAITSNDITVNAPVPGLKGDTPGFSLALLAIVEGVQGAYDVKLDMLTPSGKVLGSGKLKVNEKDMKTCNLVFKFPTFPAVEEGWHKAVLTIGNNQVYEHKFQIKSQAPVQ